MLLSKFGSFCIDATLCCLVQTHEYCLLQLVISSCHDRLLMEKTQGMPGYIRHIITDLLSSQDLQIVSLLQYQTEYDDYTWPDFEMIAGHSTVVTRKKSMLRTKNKWAFHAQVGFECVCYLIINDIYINAVYM